MNDLKVFELFSGIGGLHFALEDSMINATVIAAADINTTANKVYCHNFPKVKMMQNNIQSFTAKMFNDLSADMILMSPPCQPFTRVGLQKDTVDNRSCALLHLISIIPEISNTLKYLLLENVRGFETSESRTLLVQALHNSGFSFQEFLLSPFQFRIPNSRERYYLIAKQQKKFTFTTEAEIAQSLPPVSSSCKCKRGNTQEKISDILEISDTDANYDKLLVKDKDLKKRAWLYDIVNGDSIRSCCFTKAYSHYAEGTGSIYSPFAEGIIRDTYSTAKEFEVGSDEYLHAIKSLKLRYFSPREVARLMCFPETFSFPDGTSIKQMYRLLGNSINVHVVGHLIRYLCDENIKEGT